MITNPPYISDDERQQRAAAVRAARASNQLEGYVHTARYELIDQDFISGAIDLAQYLAAYRQAAATPE